MKVIDVTLPLGRAVPVYPGNPPFSLEAIKRIANGDSSNVSAVHMSVHAGTHVDAPRHYFDDSDGADQLPLELLIGPARVVELDVQLRVGAADLEEFDFSGDTRVLFKTRNSRLWNSPEFQADYVGFTEEAARRIVDQGVKLVGVDYLTVEVFKTPGAPAHRTLLGAGVVIIEGLDLSEASAGRYEMICLPLPIVGADAAPARVVLRRS